MNFQDDGDQDQASCLCTSSSEATAECVAVDRRLRASKCGRSRCEAANVMTLASVTTQAAGLGVAHPNAQTAVAASHTEMEVSGRDPL